MLKKLPLLPVFALAFFSGCSHKAPKPLQIQAQDQLPALVAEYETTVMKTTDHDGEAQQRQYRWRFWRASDRIETLNLQDNSGEIWAKSSDGTISYQRVFHDQQQVIDYLPGDLKAIGAQLDWSALATLLNQAMLDQLHADDEQEFLGRPAMHYTAEDPDHPLQIVWLEQEQLPALIKRTEHGHTIVTRLTATYPLAKSPWPHPLTSEYRGIDFADIGDKENDPFIKSILPKIKGGHSHGD